MMPAADKRTPKILLRCPNATEGSDASWRSDAVFHASMNLFLCPVHTYGFKLLP